MITLYAYYLFVGIISSFLAGLLGVGGGLITVPALLFIFSYFHVIEPHFLMPIVIATSLAGSISNLTSSIASHHRQHNIRWDVVRRISLGILVGALFIGPFLMSVLSGSYLMTIFGIGCFFFSVQMLFPLKKENAEEHIPDNIVLSLIGAFIGTISTLLGLAGGVMIGTFLNQCSMDMRKVVGTTAAIAILLSVAATISLMILGLQTHEILPAGCWGYIYWPAVLGLAIPSPFFAPLGAKAAQKLPVLTLKKLFATLIFLVGIKMLV